MLSLSSGLLNSSGSPASSICKDEQKAGCHCNGPCDICTFSSNYSNSLFFPQCTGSCITSAFQKNFYFSRPKSCRIDETAACAGEHRKDLWCKKNFPKNRKQIRTFIINKKKITGKREFLKPVIFFCYIIYSIEYFFLRFCFNQYPRITIIHNMEITAYDIQNILSSVIPAGKSMINRQFPFS